MTVTPAAEPRFDGGEVPDWLSTAEDKPSDEEAVSDWLAGAGAAAAFATQADEDFLPAAQEREQPAWMSFMSDSDKSSQSAFALQDEGDLAAGTPSGEPDWLNELESSFPDMPSAQSAGAADAGAVTAFGGTEEPSAFDSDFGEGLPGWLTGTAGDADRAAAAASDAFQSSDEASLMPAELPSWLEAMRPVESVGGASETYEEGDAYIEGAGPLTGLRNVLQAEPDISQIKKPPVYAIKLEISDLNQAQAQVFSQLLQQEGEAKPIPAVPVITSQRLLRMVLAALLILTILVALLPNFPPIVERPLSIAPGARLNELVNGLGNGAPVLLAVDYEPGLSGEMDAVAGAVVDHLMIRGAFLTLVSTLPTGPIQAERLVMTANQMGSHQYQPSLGKDQPGQYVNLGYIAGGAAGLRGFAEDPHKAVPYLLDRTGFYNSRPAWSSDEAQLLTVLSMQDFAMVIVATEKPDVVRNWVEQVQPKLGGKPLVLVTSAQVEPIVHPYYQSGQVSAFISGLTQGAAYENSLGREGNASRYWAPYSVGILVTILLVLLGAGTNAALSLVTRRNAAGESAGKS